MNAVFYGRVRFLSRAAPFDCGLANWSYMAYYCLTQGVVSGLNVLNRVSKIGIARNSEPRAALHRSLNSML